MGASTGACRYRQFRQRALVWLRKLVSLCAVILAAAVTASSASAQGPNAVVRGVSITFATEGRDARTSGVSLAFATEGADAVTSGVSVSFAAEGGDARARGVSVSFAQQGGDARPRFRFRCLP